MSRKEAMDFRNRKTDSDAGPDLNELGIEIVGIRKTVFGWADFPDQY